MAVLFGNGFKATPNPWWDPNHLGLYLQIQHNRILLVDTDTGAYSALGLKPIVSGDKFIFSVKLIFNQDNNTQHYTVGFATHDAYLNQHIGQDQYGFGLFNTGEVYYNNNIITSGFPTWNNNGDILDIAIDRTSEKAWFRVNGGYWNNDNSANPATDTNGFDFSSFGFSGQSLYPGLTIEGSTGPSEYQLIMSPYGIPDGFSIIEDGGRVQTQPNPSSTPSPTPTPTPTPTPEITTPITRGFFNSGVSISSGFNPYGPGNSYLFNGTSGYITLTGNTDTSFGTGDFTVEWNQFENVHNSHARIFAIGQYAGACSIEVSLEAGSFYLRENNAWVASPSYGAILQNWVHFAIVRIAGTTTIYKDGNSIYSFSDSNDLSDSSTDLHIGQESPVTDSGAYFNGAITSFRWTKGLGIYTGNFQKPTGPLGFTASANPFGGSNTQAITSGYVKYLLQPAYPFLLNVGFDKASYPNTSPITLYSNASTLSTGMYLYTDPELTTLYVPALNSNINDFNDGTHLIAVSLMHPQEDGLITAVI